MTCEHCELSNLEILFQNETLVVAVKDKVFTPGQITVFPKEHFTIMEQVPEEILAACAKMANKVSVAVFDSLGSEGTNILVQNGTGAGQKVPHFSIEVIPRRQEDGLNFQWQPKHLTEDDLAMTLDVLKKGLESKGEVKVESAKEEAPKRDEDNYLLKSLRRIP